MKKKKKLRQRYKNRKLVFEYLKAHPCELCGETDPACLEFDHVYDKRHNVSELVNSGAPEDILIREIRKTRVLCSNCHKKHTAREQGWYANLMTLEERKAYHAKTKETPESENSRSITEVRSDESGRNQETTDDS